MLYRNARIDDIADCIALLRKEGACRLSDQIYEALPTLWAHLLRDGGLASWQVFESGGRIIAFRLSAFFDEEFAADYMRRPYRQVAAAVWERSLSGRSPILDRQRVARQNVRGELNLGVLHATARKRTYAHPVMARLLTMLPSSFQVAHAGYRIRRMVFYEVFGPATVRMMRTIGFRPYDLPPELSADERAVHPAGDSQVFFWDPEDHLFETMPVLATAAVGCPMPRFRFSPAQQRLMLAALEGRADREIALTLGVRQDTLRQTWEAIYRRVDQVDGRLLPGGDDGRDGRRGSEKRRNLIEYCRQHLEELRPWDWREVPEDLGADTAFHDTGFEDTVM